MRRYSPSYVKLSNVAAKGPSKIRFSLRLS
jgi:hypothetical protein